MFLYAMPATQLQRYMSALPASFLHPAVMSCIFSGPSLVLHGVVDSSLYQSCAAMVSASSVAGACRAKACASVAIPWKDRLSSFSSFSGPSYSPNCCGHLPDVLLDLCFILDRASDTHLSFLGFSIEAQGVELGVRPFIPDKELSCPDVF